MKFNDKVVGWRDLAGWYGIPTLIFQNGWCIWFKIIYAQPIIAGNVYCIALLLLILEWKALNLTKNIYSGYAVEQGLNQSVEN